MRRWHSLFEVLKFPLGVLFFALVLMGTGNLLTNSAFSGMYTITNEFVLAAGEIMVKFGSFLITNFPLLFLIRVVARKAGSACTILSAVCGYVIFQYVTMYFTESGLPSTAYSSILGISMTSTSVASLSGSTHYPLQTGVIATVVVALSTLTSFSHSRNHSEYGFFSFISKDGYCVIRTVFWSIVGALAVSFVWPYLVQGMSAAVTFISADTTNPINLTLYGVLDQFLSVFNLSAWIRTPFWYNSSGGTWINMAGGSIAGDVNIWTGQLVQYAVNGMSGRFITPYYVLNIFAVPGLIWGVYSLQTDILEKRRSRMFFILATLTSMFTGTLLPLNIMLFLLSPILFLFHLALSGSLFGIFQAMGTYLGFNYAGSNVMTAMPGTLMEFLSYLNRPSMSTTMIRVAAVGVAFFVIYFFMTRFYFNHLALDLFNTGDSERMIKGTIKAVGGIENIKMIHSSFTTLTISVYDPNRLDVNSLKQMGSGKIYETKAGFAIGYGAASTMVRKGISKSMRSAVRSV